MNACHTESFLGTKHSLQLANKEEAKEPYLIRFHMSPGINQEEGKAPVN